MTLQVIQDFKKQNKAVRIMTISDFIEVAVCSFCGPIINKGIFSSESVSSKMLALSNLIICVFIIFWNWVFNEKRRYKLFQKTYIFSLVSYSLGMIICSLLTVHFGNILIYFWMELAMASTVGRVYVNCNMELWGNLFSTEERKTYDRMHSTLMAVAQIIGTGFAVFISTSVYFGLGIWGMSYLMDIISMSFVFIWCNKRGLLKPRQESTFEEKK